jgi:GAF domain-containing protein
MQNDSDEMTGILQAQARLQEIRELGLLSSDVDSSLKALCAEAAQEFGLPIGLVSIVLDEAQHFAASHGLGGWLEQSNGTPIEWSFCRYAVASREPFVVEDARVHGLVHENPLVTQDGVRCYAGIPLISSRGFALGSMCVIGTEERSFSEQDLAQLRGFADRVLAHIESRRAPASGGIAA